MNLHLLTPRSSHRFSAKNSTTTSERTSRNVWNTEATLDLLEKYNEKFGFIELGKLAIDYSDGIINAGSEVNPELLKYASDKNLPIMPFKDGLTGDDYSDFYDIIYGNE